MATAYCLTLVKQGVLVPRLAYERPQGRGYVRLRETAQEDQNVEALSQFLAITQDKASEIARADYLFAD